MVTTYEFPNQWNWRLFLSISNNGEKVFDILQHLNQKQNCKFDLKYYSTSTIQAPCFVHDEQNLIGVICLDQYSFDTKHIMICVHQLVHEMISISVINGCQINLYTSECWAYFLGNMVQMVLEVLNSYQEELNQKNKKCVKKSKRGRKKKNES